MAHNKGLPDPREISTKGALTKTAIPSFSYCLNPYIGCAHSCKYCYASFMKRFTGHREPWGEFVDARTNMPEVLSQEVRKKPRGRVLISSVTDPYQPAEEELEITRNCLLVLAQAQWPVDILTKSPLVVRDMDVFKTFEDISIGITITTDSESIRKTFEPNAPPLAERRRALRLLKKAGVPNYAFVGPILPMVDAPSFAAELGEIADHVLLDRMNYIGKTRNIYREKGLVDNLSEDYFDTIADIFARELGDKVEFVWR